MIKGTKLNKAEHSKIGKFASALVIVFLVFSIKFTTVALHPTFIDVNFKNTNTITLAFADIVNITNGPENEESIAKKVDALLMEARDNIPQDIEKALELTDKALMFAYASESDNLKADTFYLIGVIYYFNGQMLISNYYYELALTLYEASKNYARIEAIYNNMGVNAELINDYQQSLIFYSKSLAIAQQLGDEHGVAMTKLNMGLLYKKLDIFDKAMEKTNEVYQFFKDYGDQYHTALALMNKGVIYAYFNYNTEEAVENYLTSIEIFRRINNPYMESRALMNLSVYYQSVGRHIEALSILDSLDKNNLSIDRDSEINIKIIKAFAYFDILEIDKAIELTDEILYSYQNEDIADEVRLRAIDILFRRFRFQNDFENASLMMEDKTRILTDINRSKARVLALENSALNEHKLAMAQPESPSSKNKIPKFIIILGFALGIGVIIWVFIRKIKPTSHQKKVVYSQDNLINETIQDQETLIVDLNEAEDMLDLDSVEEFNVTFTNITTSEEDVEKTKQLYENICNYLESEKAYLNPDLKINDLVKYFHSNVKYISHAINVNTGYNFNRFLNAYRVNEAKRLLKYSDDKYDSLIDLALAVGFTNETTFFRNFKFFTDKTPTEYRLLLRKKKEERIHTHLGINPLK